MMRKGLWRAGRAMLLRACVKSRFLSATARAGRAGNPRITRSPADSALSAKGRGRGGGLLTHALSISVVVIAASGAGASPEQGEQSIYLGTEVCRGCHDGPGRGHHFSVWRASKHAGAYASLWSPQAREIARLSGIPEEPQESPMCLGCHSTAGDAEDWQRGETFHPHDGMQCERCHGPRSAHVDAAMAGRPIAKHEWEPEAVESLCMVCHMDKGSHEAVLKVRKFDFDEAWATIAHPRPPSGAPASRRTNQNGKADRADGPLAADASKKGPKYVGVMACAACHQGPRMAHQFSRWRESPHARAYAVLGTAAGGEAARKAGVADDPQASRQCLGCHVPAASAPVTRLSAGFSLADGVQCEDCHGPGSEYMLEAVMLDHVASGKAGLKAVGPKTCAACHNGVCPMDTKPLDYTAAVKAIAHPTRLPQATAAPRYKTPVNLAISPDGRLLLIACEASDSVIAVETSTRRKAAEITVGRQPNDVTFSPDGTLAYVSARLTDSVEVIDVAARRVVDRIAVGDEPHGLVTDQSGRWLYVLNSGADRISVVDTQRRKEVKRLAAGRLPWSLAISPNGRHVKATNSLPQFDPFRTPPRSEVTVIDTDAGTVADRPLADGANLCQGIAYHPSGEFALMTLMRHKNLVPMTRLVRGWTITNGLGIIWDDGRIDQVLLDEPNRYFPDATDVAISPDGRWAYVTSSGADRVAVVDVDRLVSLIRGATEHERKHVLPNHLGKSVEFVVTQIAVKDCPRGVTISPDGKHVYVVNALDDSISVIDAARRAVVDRIDLGGPEAITTARLGERIFHSANVTFQRQFSCHTCHPDGHVDGLTYDIEPDGIGVAPVDNRTLRGILDTAPFKWEGTNPSLRRQCGPRLAVFFTRIDPYSPDELSALDEYICTIPRPPNRYRVGAELTPPQRRGKALFERAVDNTGQVMAPEQRCVICHPPPYYTNRKKFDVGTKLLYDTDGEFDVPHLNNIYDSAPYLHNGMAPTLEEIWTRFNPHDQHGRTNDMTKDQLNDLIEYLKTL